MTTQEHYTCVNPNATAALNSENPDITKLKAQQQQ